MGSLRQRIVAANTNPGPDTIVFDVAGTITVMTTLPAITDDETEIHGDTAPGGGLPPRVTVQAGAVLNYGVLLDGADDCVVRGLRVAGFTVGIDVSNGAASNEIGQSGLGQMNVATACTTGIVVRQPGSELNVLKNNRCFSNGKVGILIRGASRNVVGGLGTLEANSTFQNDVGIVLDGTLDAASWNEVYGNMVGTDLSGSAPGLGNASVGVIVRGPNCVENTLANNVVVGSGAHGIARDSGGGRNKLRFNMIGMNVSGALPLPNTGHGVYMIGACDADTIGPGNVISANGGSGISVADDLGMGHHIYGNKIGTDVAGVAVHGNMLHGINFRGDRFRIGGNVPTHGNLIRGNGEWGIYGMGFEAESTLNVMWANEILENGSGGIHMDDGMIDNLIGDLPTGLGLPNHIHDNFGPGVQVGPVTPVGGGTPVEIKILTNVIEGNTIPIALIEYLGMAGNDLIPSPMIDSAVAGSVSGEKILAAGNPTYIQVFWDDGAGGFGFVGDTNVAAFVTSWTVSGTYPGGSALYATNTAVYAGNPTPETSAFSLPYVAGVTGVLAGAPDADSFGLRLAGPNPVRDVSRLSFKAPREMALRLDVHDLAGRLVRSLWNGRVDMGTHAFEWNGDDSEGARVVSGVYLVRASFDGAVETERITRIR
jgi:parallel beta-helix repeat protein